MRKINYIVVHCSATKENKYFNASDINKWHLNRGWSGIGYHYVVLLDGTIEQGRPEEITGAHVRGYNKNSIGVVYVGGLDGKGNAKDTRTIKQKESLKTLLKSLKSKHRNASILGHRDFSKDINKNGSIEPNEYMKQCPCFNAIEEYKEL